MNKQEKEEAKECFKQAAFWVSLILFLMFLNLGFELLMTYIAANTV